jgi:predicted nucleic acid-binding protein
MRIDHRWVFDTNVIVTKDDKFLEVAVCGRASGLATGDPDLLALHPFRSIPLITPIQFLEKFGT